MTKLTKTRACVLVLLALTTNAVEADSTFESWVNAFFELYSEFNGSHISLYADDVLLTDVFLKEELKGKSEIEQVYRIAAQRYKRVRFVVEAIAVQTQQMKHDGQPSAAVWGTAVVRGRIVGAVDEIDFDMAFVTWLEVESGLIRRQLDYVDYSTLTARLSSAAGESKHPETP